ncbi:MAG: HAD family phosphatase [Ignavibacteria bacterium]|nr:HAD family phosphatase [Ignavibacteria bacterium]
MNAKKIQAVVFDYGNVIARFDVSRYLKAIAPRSALSVGGILQELERSHDLFVRYETGRVTSGEFFRMMIDRCRLTMTQDQFVEAYTSIFEPVNETHTLIRNLHGRYRLALLSNTSEWHYQWEIAKSPVFSLFEQVTLSHEVQARKPSPLIYQDVLKKLNLPPSACVYIDDIAEFAEAATGLGMTGIHYTTSERLLQSIEEAGVRTSPS